jgi:uncharacterized protein (DUF362 family)/ferredoxin
MLAPIIEDRNALLKMNEKVVVLRTQGDIANATRRALDMIGPISAILAGRRLAILKPNFVAGRPARTGATTHFEMIASVAEAVHTAGASPVLCEFPGTEFDFEATLTILKVLELCAQYEIGLIRKVDHWLELRPPGNHRLKRYRIPAQLEDACLINLPVLKTHVVSGMSICMKNLMGLLPLEDRRNMHTLGIQQCIVDLNRGIIPDLNIVDGSVGQDGEGPLYGKQVNMDAIIAGRDALAVDLACCKLAGVDPNRIGHLKLGSEQLGKRRITMTGDETAPTKPMELPRVPAVYRGAYRLMYLLDYAFKPLTGSHFCTKLYQTGLFGTRPHIEESLCNQCENCIQACPLPNVIDLKNYRINPGTCERCLLCFEACPEGAITVKGMTGSRQTSIPHLT